jgi:hypothetical protein
VSTINLKSILYPDFYFQTNYSWRRKKPEAWSPELAEDSSGISACGVSGGTSEGLFAVVQERFATNRMNRIFLGSNTSYFFNVPNGTYHSIPHSPKEKDIPL